MMYGRFIREQTPEEQRHLEALRESMSNLEAWCDIQRQDTIDARQVEAYARGYAAGLASDRAIAACGAEEQE